MTLLLDKKEYDRLRYISRKKEFEIKMKENCLREKQTNPKAQMIRRLRTRAKQKGLEFSLTAGDIDIPAFCPVLGIPLNQGTGGLTGNSPSLDRVDNSKGYVKGNVRVISNRANSIKRDATLQELEQLVNYMRGRP